LKIEILSTGGTAKLLRDEGVTVKDVSELTGWPEMLGGRVKTLHPKVHGGLLYRRNHAEDQKQAKEHGIAAIDLLVVNLYPFEATAAKGYLTPEELIENIDIGGPTMLRSAAKNFESVTVVADPADYGRVAQELEKKGETTLPLRAELARKVFATTSRYDGLIATELERLAVAGHGMEVNARAILPERLHLALRKQQELRYGENPHQAAALYVPAGRAPEGLAAAKQLQGCAQPGSRIRAACRGDHQAQQPVRCGAAVQSAGCVSEGVCVRPDLGVRGGAGVQPHCGRGDGGSGVAAVRGVHRSAGICG
jgi:phosphoribosylaminoimidazolecarboxamide formyltransferase/IMP cyclohydrolase